MSDVAVLVDWKTNDVPRALVDFTPNKLVTVPTGVIEERLDDLDDWLEHEYGWPVEHWRVVALAEG